MIAAFGTAPGDGAENILFQLAEADPAPQSQRQEFTTKALIWRK
jgi:hypothetical protein